MINRLKRAILRMAEDSKDNASAAVTLPKLQKPLLLLGHELKNSGAAILLMNLANCYACKGFDVVLAINAGSPMQEEAVAALDSRIHLFQFHAGSAECRALFSALQEQGCDICIANTVVTGLFAQDLKDFGMKVTWLIHEMTCSCKILRAQTIMENIRQSAQAVVFPAKIVCEHFRSMCADDFICPTPILPQGLYKTLTKPSRDKDAIRADFEKQMSIPKDAVLLAGAGAVNFGKGCDMLVPILTKLKSEGERGNYHVLWLGKTPEDDPYYIWLCAQIKAAGLEENWHWTGYVSDNAKYVEYIYASDLFVLPSREDSYPSVMLEAQSLGVPVLAFEGSGGGADIARMQHGFAAKPSDISDFCRLVGELTRKDQTLQKRIEECASRVQEQSDFSKYAEDVLNIACGNR